MSTLKKILSFSLLISLLVSMLFATAASADETEYFDADGNMIVPFIKEPITYKVLYKKQKLDIGTIEDKAGSMLDTIANDLNIHFTFEIVEEAAWTEKLNLVFATGQLPDIIWGDIPDLSSHLDQVLDITELVDKYTVWIKNFYKEFPDYYKGESIAGRLYSFSSIQKSSNRSHTFLEGINMKWLEKLNLQVPNTLEELTDVLRAFRDNDPNGNGIADEIGISFVSGYSKGHGSMTLDSDNMRANFGILDDGVNASCDDVMVRDGKVIFVPADEKYYDMIKWMHLWYSEGLLDKDGFTQTENDLMQKGEAERLGYIFGNAHIYNSTGTALQYDYDYILPMMDENGKRIVEPTSNPSDFIKHVFTLSKDCPHPEYLVLMVDYINSTEERQVCMQNGVQGEFQAHGSQPEGYTTTIGWWYTEVDGVERIQNNSNWWPKDKGYNNYSQFRLSIRMNNPPMYLTTYADKRILSAANLRQVARDPFYRDYYYNEMFPLGEMSAEDSIKRAEMRVEIDTYVESFFAESVINGIDEGKWAKHLDTLKALHIDEYMADYQALYDYLIQQ